MPKRLSENQKQEILKNFIDGISIDQLSEKFSCVKATIIRNLKKELGEQKYKDQISKNKNDSKFNFQNKKNILNDNENLNSKKIDFGYLTEQKINNEYILEEEFFPPNSFMEITPLNLEIENAPQKDLSSIPISDMNFPNIVYMVVDKKIELETKLLKEYPEWQFLSQSELNRKTIEIFLDLKIAKRFCNKEQKVIKIPNTDIFRIVAPILVSRGISRIVSADKLIAL